VSKEDSTACNAVTCATGQMRTWPGLAGRCFRVGKTNVRSVRYATRSWSVLPEPIAQKGNHLSPIQSLRPRRREQSGRETSGLRHLLYRLAEPDTGGLRRPQTPASRSRPAYYARIRGSSTPPDPREPKHSPARIGLSPRPSVRADEHSGPANLARVWPASGDTRLHTLIIYGARRYNDARDRQPRSRQIFTDQLRQRRTPDDHGVCSLGNRCSFNASGGGLRLRDGPHRRVEADAG
jgi:hypothetical protein